MRAPYSIIAKEAGRLLVPSALGAVLAVLVLAPVLVLLGASLLTAAPFSGNRDIGWTLANYANLWSPALAQAAANTLVIAAFGAALAMVIGCGLAWLAARSDIPGRAFVHLAGVAPLLISLLVASVTWSLLGAGNSGYLNLILRDLGLPFRIEMQSLGGIALVMGLYYAPYPFILLYGALTLVHPDLEEAAAIHGADLSRLLRRVTFPLVKPALIGAALLVVVLIVEDFPVPEILGAPVNIETLSIRIYNLMAQVPALPNQAAALSVLLTIVVCVLVYTQRRIIAGKDYRTVTGKGMRFQPVSLRWLRWPAFLLVALYAFVAVILPLLALLEGALRRSLFVPDAASLLDVAQFSLTSFSRALANPAVLQGFTDSLIAGAATALIGSTLFFGLAYVVNRTQLPGRRLLEYLVMMPLAIPALVMGLGILWTWVAAPVPVYGTMAILVIAFLTRFMPQGYRAVASSLVQIHDDLEHAALIAGASKGMAIRRIILPLARGGITSAAFLMVVLAIRELTASLFLYTTKTRLLSIVLYESYENGAWGTVASVSLIYTGLLMALALLGRRWMRADF
jgi:iron(III) transport system permease protein